MTNKNFQYLIDLKTKDLSDHTQPGVPGLGIFNPLNIFKTPFASERRKVSWYLKSPFFFKAGNNLNFFFIRIIIIIRKKYKQYSF